MLPLSEPGNAAGAGRPQSVSVYEGSCVQEETWSAAGGVRAERHDYLLGRAGILSQLLHSQIPWTPASLPILLQRHPLKVVTGRSSSSSSLPLPCLLLAIDRQRTRHLYPLRRLLRAAVCSRCLMRYVWGLLPLLSRCVVGLVAVGVVDTIVGPWRYYSHR